MEKIVKSYRKIRFQDCDPFNHLNNSRYIDYFINAREDQLLENYNFNIFQLAEKQGLGWLIASNQIHYLKPALTMETVLIDSQLIQFTAKNLLVEMRMWDEGQTKLKAILWTNFIHLDLKSKRVINHADEFTKLFEQILLPVEQMSIEERRNYLIRQKMA